MNRIRFLLAIVTGLSAALGARADVNHYRSGLQAEPSLLSFYPFDGDAGTVATDRVPPLQNGTLSGATFSSAAGTVGSQAVQGARVALGPVADYEFADTSGTVEMFLYQTATAAFNPCFFAGRDDSQSPAVRYSLHGGTAGNQLFIWNGSAAPNVSTPISMLNTRVHVAFVFEAGQVTVYFNGAKLVTWNEPLGAGVGRAFQIGASGPANQEAWPGRIDEVAIYGEALPATAVAAHYATWLTAASGTPPVLTQQPQNLALDDGQIATFAIQLADATDALYRWTRNGTNIPGATNATLTISPATLADNNSIFRCVVYNPYGGTNSSTAILAVRTPPSFITAPANTVGYITQASRLSAEVNGSLPLTFQWFKNGSLLPNATNSSLNFPALELSQAGAYVLRVTNVFGAVTSAPALLAVVPVLIVNPPHPSVRFVGQSVTFEVAAAGVGPLTYQWFKGSALLAGQTNSALALDHLGLPDAGAYSVAVGNIYGSTNPPAALLTLLNPETPQTVLSPPPFEWLPQDNGTLADGAVLFSEIMYHPAGSKNLQWIELQNVMRVDVDISNWRLDGGVNYRFPAGTIIPGGGFVVVAKDIPTFTNATGMATAFGPFTNNIYNGGEHLVLRNHDNRMMDEMTYDNEEPWPEGADGSGATLAKRTPLSSSAEPINWSASPQLGGTPGRANFSGVFTLPHLACNEIEAATSAVVRVELHNYDPAPVNLSGFVLRVLTTNGAVNLSLPGITLPAGGFVVLDENQLGVRPVQDNKLFLLTSNSTVLVDAAVVKNRRRARAPEGIGRWVHPALATFGTSNLVTLNHDIVINEIMYEALPSYPSNIFTPSGEEWVELYNRGATMVNLTGWRLDHGIHYTFPTNTLLAPGRYLVVAKDAAAVAAAHPGATVLGNSSGSLARTTDLIELKDAADDVVNEVRYFSDHPWPSYPAGGGSSLELTDPYADNRRAESWAASDESGSADWQTITYRSPATANKGYDVGHNIWNEFVLGLLDAGEFLLDDVTVTEAPGTGGARQLIQNGTFESDAVGQAPATWRVLGNHGLHGGTVVATDPANPGNKVLHVLASGATDFLHNHLETTLKSGGTIVAVVPGQQYEISFRVRWLGGNRLLNTRLYANWLQRTTVLAVPAAHGTPGANNSRRVASAGPTYSRFGHAPAIPAAGANITVSLDAYAPQGIAELTLWWRLDGASWNSAPMQPQGTPGHANEYRGTILGQAGGAKVQFYVEGRDALGGVSKFPAAGAESRAMFVVNDGQALAAPNFNLRFVMTAAETARLYFNTNRMSNERQGATIIYNESEVFYDVGVRLKGSAFGRDNDSETGLSIDFASDHKFRGAHSSVSVERGGSKREILARHLFNQAGGGVAAGYDDIAYIITPRAQDAGRCILSTTRTTDTLLATEYGGGGTLYNLELLYTPTTTVNGNAEAPKLNFPYVHTSGAPDIQDLGDDKEAYRWNFQLRNNRERDDFTLMMSAAKSFELNGAALDAATRKVLDVDQWLRCFAMESLVGNDDFYTRFYNHNFRMYQRPEDNRLVALPWDLDRAFNYATTVSLWGNVPDQFGGTNRMRKIIEYPPNLRAYYQQLLDLIALCYNPGYATRWADHYATLIGDNSLSALSAYIAARATFVQSQIPAFPNFNITTSNGLDFAANANLVTLTGNAPFALRYLSVNGELFDPGWPTLTNWSLQLALPAGTNVLNLQALDRQGRVLSNVTASISIVINGSVDDPVGKVVFNEINYRPRQANAEFIELFNNSATTAFDLAGWRLNGSGLTFAKGTILLPRGFLLVAADRISLASTYGPAAAVSEEFPGHIDGAGETLTLLKPGVTPDQDVIIDQVRYEPGAPWPVAADGGGQSLQLIDPAQENARVSNWTDGAGWRFFYFTNRIGGSRLSFLFSDSQPGDVFLDDLSLVAGTVPGVGQNLIVNGGFESELSPPWNAGGIGAGSHRTNGVAHSGSSSLHFVQGVGGISLTAFYQDVMPSVVTNTVYTLSGWVLVSGANTNLVLRAGSNYQAKPPLQPTSPTPGLPNFGAAALPAYPALWLNEIQPVNQTGPTDNAGQHDPWVEIYNHGPEAVSLAGYSLANNYTNLAQWSFPAGSSIAAGQFLVVWLDGETSQSSATVLHANFRPAGGQGTLALSRTLGGGLQLVDYLNYTGVEAPETFGDLPDAQPFFRRTMFYPTPGAANDDRSSPAVIFINEWMAANTSASGFPDPADGQFDDWFELYNPGSLAVDLGGYFLTDNLTNHFQFEIPNNGRYVIPAGGYLLVWADGSAAQNSTNRPDLHVSFNLRAAGEAIGLFAANGLLIDAVTFTNQSDNISMGRSPDGGTTLTSFDLATPLGANVSGPVRPLVSIQVQGANVILVFTTVPGQVYRVQFKDQLEATNWLDLPGDVTATGSSTTKMDTHQNQQRFYRVKVLP